jgi:hypothetical protein
VGLPVAAPSTQGPEGDRLVLRLPLCWHRVQNIAPALLHYVRGKGGESPSSCQGARNRCAAVMLEIERLA